MGCADVVNLLSKAQKVHLALVGKLATDAVVECFKSIHVSLVDLEF
jgi:hypothetical protein